MKTIKQTSKFTFRNSRTFTSSVLGSTILPQGSSTLSPLNSWFVTGFADAESSFIVSLSKNNKYKQG